ncbi:cytochrome P450 [Streptomyces sp. P9(2023)]|nr:cytochrome P450 [Streptomyces sp. P9(2023)]
MELGPVLTDGVALGAGAGAALQAGPDAAAGRGMRTALRAVSNAGAGADLGAEAAPGPAASDADRIPDGAGTGGRPEGGAVAPAGGVAAMRRARWRDRRVYTRSHPVLFALLAAVRRRAVVRLGRAVLVSGTEAYREALTRIPLDRAAAGTTGGAARELSGGGTLFDQEGADHRDARRAVAEDLGAAGVEQLRPVWRAVLDRELAPLAAGQPVDLVPLARELAGATVRAMLDCPAGATALAEAAGDAAAAAVRDHLPGPRPPGTARAAARATARLEALLGGGATSTPSRTAPTYPHRGKRSPGTTPPCPGGDRRSDPPCDGPGTHPSAPGPRPRQAPTPSHDDIALRAMIAVAAVNTTVAALPRAVAWCADGGLWEQAADDRLRPVLVGELLRVVAPSPLLPRVAAADAVLEGCPVKAGDRLVLVARHAVGADVDPPDAHRPAPPAVSRLVFGAGPHACPGARLALAQLDDVLAALAPYRPAVVTTRVDRRAALPGWRRLTVRATTTPRPRTENPS